MTDVIDSGLPAPEEPVPKDPVPEQPVPEQPVPVDPRFEQIKLILKGILATSIVFQWILLIGMLFIGWRIADAYAESEIFTRVTGIEVTAWDCFWMRHHLDYTRRVDGIIEVEEAESESNESEPVIDQDAEAPSTDTGG